MPITPEEIGRRLRLVCKSRQISQETAGAEIGREHSAISRIESGDRPVYTSLGQDASDGSPDEDSAVLSLVRRCS